MKTVILADCHIGSPESNYRAVNKVLNGLECRRLILLGDFWDLWEDNSEHLRERYADTIALLRKILAAGTKVDLVLGNHDEDYLGEPIMPLSEVDVMHRSEISLPNGKVIALVHGHEFDPIFKKWYIISRMLSWINVTAKKLIGISAKTFKKNTCTDLTGKKYSDTVEDIHKEAKKSYLKMGYDGLIMGHTHCPTYQEGEKFLFVNAGDWKWSNTYVEIEGDTVSLKRYEDEK